jgi:hypothetical protein
MLFVTQSSLAVCLDDKGVSGYHIPLNLELKTNVAVIIGETIGSKDLMEDFSDPDGITATVWKIQVKKVIRGKIEPTFEIYNQNDSGRFPFDLHKTYLLFITSANSSGPYINENFLSSKKFKYWADPCGSSGEELESKSVLSELNNIK